MQADHIKDIIQRYDESPYECILIDGVWGVGKTYAIRQALADNTNVCNISMFGIKDAQEIYHEVLFQLVAKGNKKIATFLPKIIDVASAVSDKVASVRDIIDAFVKEKELFFTASNAFDELHLIVIDDIERMNATIKLEEVFGIIDELKRCNHIKVFLVANTEEISQKDAFEKYSEKVIDRVYHITASPEKVDWCKLRIHHGFITEFLERHKVKNLRTLQKAQNLYDDVRSQLNKDYIAEFYDEIRLACFAIVVESVDNLYYREPEDNQTDTTHRLVRKISNELNSRIYNYMHGTKISNNMVKLLQDYFEKNSSLNPDAIDAEYQLFIDAGEKPNYYKSDDELRAILPILADMLEFY